MQYDEPYTGDGRITLTSIVLLVIFVSAAALIVAAIIWRPWFDEDSPPAVQGAVAEEQAPADQAAGEGPAPEAAGQPAEVAAGQ